eukprot:7194200-Prymnesium_polylepis.1
MLASESIISSPPHTTPPHRTASVALCTARVPLRYARRTLALVGHSLTSTPSDRRSRSSHTAAHTPPRTPSTPPRGNAIMAATLPTTPCAVTATPPSHRTP